MWNLKYDTNEPIYKIERNSLIDIENKLIFVDREDPEVGICTGSLELADAHYCT